MPKLHSILSFTMSAILPVLLLVGCEPSFTLRGSVHEDADAADASSEPVEDAMLSLFCPRDGEMHQFYPSFSTDARGAFEFKESGVISLDCELRAQKDGYQLVDLPLRDACTEPKGDDACAKAQFEVELVPVVEME